MYIYYLWTDMCKIYYFLIICKKTLGCVIFEGKVYIFEGYQKVEMKIYAKIAKNSHLGGE